MSETSYCFGLSLVPALGPVRLQLLYEHFGAYQAIWEAPVNALRSAGASENLAHAIDQKRRSINIQSEYNKVRQAGATLITLADDIYPTLLKRIPNPPIALYVKGDFSPDDDLALGIVGTRKATRYGHDVTFDIAKSLATNHVTIVSGMAQGIDSAAHEGAIAGGGRTIAVLGTGIDRIYPSTNKQLSKKIIANGALVTEFPLGTPPLGSNFPTRNRLISGLSLGVLITEAPINSGALITVDAALEQGRDVFAVPSNIYNRTGSGCNKLIQDGAKLITGAEDIMAELELHYERTTVTTQAEQLVPDNDTEAQIFNYLSADPVHVDQIIRLSGLAPEVVTSTLTIMELKGLAQTAGAMQYCRAR